MCCSFKKVVSIAASSCFLLSFFTFNNLLRNYLTTCMVTTPTLLEQSQRTGKIIRHYDVKLKSDDFFGIQQDLGTSFAVSDHDLTFISSNRTNYFDCEDFHKLPHTYQTIKENVAGNRGISFLKININGKNIDVVFKEGTKYFSTVGDEYKYSNAKKEIEYLIKLRGKPGIPQLYGFCIEENYIGYFVERIMGQTLCEGNGTTAPCSKAEPLLQIISSANDPKLAALNIALSSSKLFELLEEEHLFVEDLSGINLMFDSSFQVYLVDADSLIFYARKRLFSGLPCSKDTQCWGPKGNLWGPISLNHKIYRSCAEINGMCERNKCRGFDNSLHACGMASWIICRLKTFFQDDFAVYSRLELVCSCLGDRQPSRRCSFSFARKHLESIMKLNGNLLHDNFLNS